MARQRKVHMLPRKGFFTSQWTCCGINGIDVTDKHLTRRWKKVTCKNCLRSKPKK